MTDNEPATYCQHLTQLQDLLQRVALDSSNEDFERFQLLSNQITRGLVGKFAVASLNFVLYAGDENFWLV
jgi:hypothetical protein